MYHWHTRFERGKLFVRVFLAGIEPVRFRVKSDLRNHQAIVQPRLYGCLMVSLLAAGMDKLEAPPLAVDSTSSDIIIYIYIILLESSFSQKDFRASRSRGGQWAAPRATAHSRPTGTVRVFGILGAF